MAADWPNYNEALVRRGEILLDLGLLHTWGEELEEMNRGKEGARHRYPYGLIKLQGLLRALFRLPYRQLEGFTHALSRGSLRTSWRTRERFSWSPQPRGTRTTVRRLTGSMAKTKSSL